MRESRSGSLWTSLCALGVLAAMLAACGAHPVTPAGARQGTILAGEVLYVLDGHDDATTGRSGMRLIAFRPASGRPAPLLTLPAGLTSQDHRRLYTTAAAAGRTTIAVVDSRTGAAERSFTVPGKYSTAGEEYDNAALSPDGHWLALRDLGSSTQQTVIALVDTQAGRVAQDLRLTGNFTLDAISLHGTMLYLLQKEGDLQHHYYVRGYDLSAGQLLPGYIVDKTETNQPRMAGTALTRQMAPDGSAAYTLYIDPLRNIAFVHILPLADSPGGLGFARCLDLPVGHSGELVRYYTLALAADNSTLYAANAGLGVAVKIGLHGDQVFNDQVDARGRFTSAATGGGEDLYTGAALSTDQRTLYVAGWRGVQALSAADLHLENSYLGQQTFTGIALGAGGKVLYAADPATGIVTLTLATGEARTIPDCPAHTPRGIAWVSA